MRLYGFDAGYMIWCLKICRKSFESESDKNGLAEQVAPYGFVQCHKMRCFPPKKKMTVGPGLVLSLVL